MKSKLLWHKFHLPVSLTNWIMSLVSEFLGQPSYIDIHLTKLSLTSLLSPSMCNFQCTGTVSRACVVEATVFGANKSTGRPSTLSGLRRHVLTKITIDSICYICYSKLSKWILQPIVWFLMANTITKSGILTTDRFHNWFPS